MMSQIQRLTAVCKTTHNFFVVVVLQKKQESTYQRQGVFQISVNLNKGAGEILIMRLSRQAT